MTDSAAGSERQPSVALITGAAGNIGRAVALALARTDARLALADLPSSRPGLEETAARCAAAASESGRAGGPAVIVPFDVTDDAAVNAGVQQVVSEAGPPTMLFNNAGYQGRFANLTDYDLDDMRRVLAINVAGVFSVLQATAKTMRDGGRGGVIVNMASMAGVSGAANMPAYSTSKAAVIGLTKSAAKDLAPFGIRVNSVSPGFIGPGVMWDRQVAEQASVSSPYYADTVEDVAAQMINMVPLRRYGSLDEVASAVVFLLSDDSSYVNGVNLEISGGGA